MILTLMQREGDTKCLALRLTGILCNAVGGSIRLPKRPIRPLLSFFWSNFLPFFANGTQFPHYIIRKTTLGMRHHKFFLGKQNKTSASQIKFTNTKHVYANFQQDSFRNRQVRASYFWTLFLLHPVFITVLWWLGNAVIRV